MAFHDSREGELQPKAKLQDVGRKGTLHPPVGHCTIFEDKLLTWRLDRWVSDMEGQSPAGVFQPRSRVLQTITLFCLRQPSDEVVRRKWTLGDPKAQALESAYAPRTPTR